MNCASVFILFLVFICLEWWIQLYFCIIYTQFCTETTEVITAPLRAASEGHCMCNHSFSFKYGDRIQKKKDISGSSRSNILQMFKGVCTQWEAFGYQKLYAF